MKIAVSAILDKTGWTRYRLSKETGISQQLIAEWAREGTAGIRFDHLVRLKEVLSLSWDEMGGLIEKEAERTAKAASPSQRQKK